MTGLRLPRGDWPLVAGGALLTVLAYPPFHLIFPSFLCLVPAVWLVRAAAEDPRPLRRALVQGFWFGFLSHGLVLYWMVFALWRFTPMSALGYAATVTILAVECGLVFAVAGWLERTRGWSLGWTFPVVWTAMEWFVGHQGDIRFPWLGLGTSLTGYPVLVQIADLVGARGVTFLLVAANVALALAWLRRHQPRLALPLVGTVVLGVGASLGYSALRNATLATRPVARVAVLQPSVPEKWDASLHESIVAHLLRLSDEALGATHPDLMAWPEAAVPDFFQRHPDWREAVARQARRHGTALLVGGLDVQFHDRQTYDIYNAAFFFDSAGRVDSSVYHKQYLVPIVERVPFVNPRWFSALKFFGAFGVGQRRPLYRQGNGTFGVLICYESAFEDLTREYRARGADYVVNITNDHWFGHTAAPYQHAAHLVMRAIENRVGAARAANNGISEFVDPFGRVHHATRLDDTTYVAEIVLTTEGRTVYNRLGDWVGWLTLVGTVVMVGWAAWMGRATGGGTRGA